MTDLSERLRRAFSQGEFTSETRELWWEAADRLEKLEAVARDAKEHLTRHHDGHPLRCSNPACTIGNLIGSLAALEPKP